MQNIQAITKALRARGFTVKVGHLPNNQAYNFWIPGGRHSKVINICTYSILGEGCYNHPSYAKIQNELAEALAATLCRFGIAFSRLLPDQIQLA